MRPHVASCIFVRHRRRVVDGSARERGKWKVKPVSLPIPGEQTVMSCVVVWSAKFKIEGLLPLFCCFLSRATRVFVPMLM